VVALALGDAILACLTERPMTGYELAKTFDASIGFFWNINRFIASSQYFATAAMFRAARWCSRASPTSWSTP
jgi:hypothetical protein